VSRSRNIALSVVLFIALVSVWEAGVRILQVPQFILPAPSKVAEALWRGIVTGIYIEHLYYTLVSTVLGFILGSALGFGLGTGVAMSRRFEFFLYPYIVMFQSLPKIALAPLIVIWFGLGLSSKIVNAALVAFFPLLVNTIVGLKSADEERVNLMRSLAASEKQIFWMLRLPNALPFVMAGLDVAMIFALIGAIVGEFVGAKHGLGMLIQSMHFTMDVSGQFSVLLILSVVGLILNRCISLIRKRVLFWDPSEKEKVEA
jgi:NitT/TauT family transport system permease protein